MDHLLTLCELFPDVPVEKLVSVIESNPDAGLERLVDACLDQSPAEPSQPLRQAGEPVEMVSLLPPSTGAEGRIGEGKEEQEAAPIGGGGGAAAEGKRSRTGSGSEPAEAKRSVGKAALEQWEKALSSLRLDLPPIDPPGSLVALRTLARCAANVLEHPYVDKYRQISMSNPRFTQKVSSLPGAIGLLEAMGFKRIDAGGTDLLVLSNDDLDVSLLSHARSQLEASLATLESRLAAPLESDPLYSLPGRGKRAREEQGSEQRAAPPTKAHRISREDMAARAASRLAGKAPPVPPAEGGIRQGRIADFGNLAKLRKEIAEVRRSQHRKWVTTRQGRKRVYTVDDLEEMRKEEIKTRGKFTGGSGIAADLNQIGQAALRLTNEFRAKHKLPPLEWHQSLADIGYVHSKDMGDGKLPFDHVGFNGRVRKYPFPSRSAAENLAMNQGCADVARVAVDGWIDSPGHRRNLLSKHSVCGIGVYRNAAGAYYLTQLFGLL